jgi:hypothetical protein
MARDFSTLNQYAKREYKFVQADSFGLITSAINAGTLSLARAGGVCMGATLKWINEKLTSSNSYIKPDGRLRGSAPREFSNSINLRSRVAAGLSIPGNTVLGKVVTSNPFLNRTFKGKSHARNESTMRQAADVQTTYANQSLDAARGEMNFVKTNTYSAVPVTEAILPRPDRIAMLGNPANEELAAKRGYMYGDLRRLEPETIAQAAYNLPPGVAILIDLNNADGGSGHAIAFYRSRPGDISLGGRTLHFFDSNAGAYRISNDAEANIKDFIRVWLRVYANHIKPVTFQTAAADWCTAFKRPDF